MSSAGPSLPPSGISHDAGPISSNVFGVAGESAGCRAAASLRCTQFHGGRETPAQFAAPYLRSSS
eukprot:2146035-Lingulodinium_polyedra.AAC.1